MTETLNPTMKAARFHSSGDIRVESVPQPIPEANEILLDVTWCGICGTDLHEFLVGPILINPKERPHRLTGHHLPITLGHEFVGYVRGPVPEGSTSANGKPLKTGDTVIVDPRLNCKSCFSCDAGEGNICSKWGFVGYHSPGAFAEKVAIDPTMCYLLPPDLPLDHAALIEPLAVGRHALTMSGIPIGDWRSYSVLVVGGGPVGFAVLCNLRAAGATRVFVSEPTTQRREQTKAWATEVFNPMQVDPAEECKRLTDGKGVHIVFDCAGVMPGLQMGLKALRPKGTYVNVAGWETEFNLPLNICMAKEITLKMSLAYDDKDFGDVVRDFVDGKFAGAQSMITAYVALEDIVKSGFEQLVANKDQHVKILVSPIKSLVDEAKATQLG